MSGWGLGTELSKQASVHMHVNAVTLVWGLLRLTSITIKSHMKTVLLSLPLYLYLNLILVSIIRRTNLLLVTCIVCFSISAAFFAASCCSALRVFSSSLSLAFLFPCGRLDFLALDFGVSVRLASGIRCCHHSRHIT